ncbi:MAG TPA: site-2 protease family protein [Acidimicrobiaceae bacterium]|nr:site-2 protease family protein [Acidimicrobiaceae bacterium]
MRQSIRIGRFAGVDVGVNWSVLVIFALITWQLADYVLPGTYGAGSRAAYWLAAVVAALVFFFSLLAHEVSHAVVARHNGVGVRSITLWLFGGVAQLEGEAASPGAEFRIAAVGPGTSLALAAVFGVGEVLAHAAGSHGLVAQVLTWLWQVNLLLAAFNLIPAAPLDGGRILRSGLWRAWHDPTRAAVAAARAGRAFGAVLIVVGVVEFGFGGALGLWPALLGWFLYAAAGSEERNARLRSSIAQLAAWQVMTPNPPTVPAHARVADMAHSALRHYGGEAVVVTDERGWLAGVLRTDAMRAVPADRLGSTMVSDIAVPLDQVPVVRTGDPVRVVLERMARAGGTPALVLDAENRLAGIVTQSNVVRTAMMGDLQRRFGQFARR